MAPYLYKPRRYLNYRKRWQPWPRRRFRFRRPRKTFRWRRRIYRRRNKYRVRKKRYFKRKLKYIYLKEFQPKKIHKCTIKGIICLFQSGPNRLNREYTQCMNSYFPEKYEGGGGWSQLKFSLESLYEQRELFRNKWTKSNVLMPLCRYNGCKLKFYRTEKVDYIVHYSLCLPMLDTLYQHTNAQPALMLLYKSKIIVPSKKNNRFRKDYIIKKLRPPEQLQNKWYFQVDFNKQPLLLLTTVACDLDRFFLHPDSINNNTTITILNTDFFQGHNFLNQNLGTQYWQPRPGYYLYGTLNGDDNPPIKQLIFLGQTRYYTKGEPINNKTWTEYSKPNVQTEYWGNPFHPDYFHGTIGMFIGQTPPNEVFQNPTTGTATTKNLSKVTQELYTHVRYTPERDTGENQIYLLKLSDPKQNWLEPDDPDLIYEGFPLWAILWGWTDWQVKYKKLTKVEESTILCIRTTFTYPEKTYIVPLDSHFVQGISPYEKESILPQDKNNWHPKLKYQQMSIENICKTGPGVAKTTTQSIEAHMYYRFYFKWGGCPNDLEQITDPGEQKHYPVPNKELQGPEIQDPNTDPKQELYEFDFRRDIITSKAAKRIKKDSKYEKLSSTDSAMQLEPTTTRTLQKIPTQIPSSTEEEEEETQIQLQQLKHKQRKLRKQLQQLIRQTPNIKF
nr:MAG: ORF1 [TTV-like mini virus]